MKKGKEMSQCAWCTMLDKRKKVLASPRDDLKEVGVYHEKCLKAYNYLTKLELWKNYTSPEEMIETANRLVKIEIKTRKYVFASSRDD